MFKTKTLQELADAGNRSTFFLQFETRDRPDPYRGYAVLRYDQNAAIPAAPDSPVVKLPARVGDWLEYTFEPLYPDTNTAPSTAEVTRRVIIDCELKQDDESGRTVWELAHLSWTESTYERPALVDTYKHGQAAIPDFEVAQRNYGWDPATMSFPAKIGEVLEIVLQNTGVQVGQLGFVESHPFYAHSKHYYNIGSGPGRYDADANNAKLARLGYRPVRRDPTMLYRHNDTVAPGQAAG